MNADLLHGHISHTSGCSYPAILCKNQEASPQSAQSQQRAGGAGGEGRWGAAERMPQEWSWEVEYEKRPFS